MQQVDTPSTDTVEVVVWTGLQPLQGINIASLWDRTLNDVSCLGTFQALAAGNQTDSLCCI